VAWFLVSVEGRADKISGGDTMKLGINVHRRERNNDCYAPDLHIKCIQAKKKKRGVSVALN